MEISSKVESLLGIDERNARDAEEMAKERATADKVRKKLEAKSRVYDRIQQGDEMDDYMRENCLVDFDGKEVQDRSRAPSRDEHESRGRSRHMSYQVCIFGNLL